jgi:rhodanese-related sulfurtransferase
MVHRRPPGSLLVYCQSAWPGVADTRAVCVTLSPINQVFSRGSAMPRRAAQRSIAIGLLLVIASLAAGCDAFGPRISDASLKYVEPEQLRQWRGNDQQPVVLIDVRSEQAFASGHLPEARHMPLPQLQPSDPRLVGDHRLVVYGRDGQDPVGPAAGKKLLGQGYTQVYVLRNGLAGWRDAGGEVTASNEAQSENAGGG